MIDPNLVIDNTATKYYFYYYNIMYYYILILPTPLLITTPIICFSGSSQLARGLLL